MKKAPLSLWIVFFCLLLMGFDRRSTAENKMTGPPEAINALSARNPGAINPSAELTIFDALITIGEKTFSAKLMDSPTARALALLFPLTVEMKDLNSNEKYHFLSKALPAAPTQPGVIHSGDIMLYNDDCIVIFYKTFPSTYQYTRLGFINDAVNFEKAIPDGVIKVTFDLPKPKVIDGK